jgi:hypothetical protein
MNSLSVLSSLVLFLLSPLFSLGVELTFELPDNAKECFFEVIEKDVEATLEYQVRKKERKVEARGLIGEKLDKYVV